MAEQSLGRWLSDVQSGDESRVLRGYVGLLDAMLDGDIEAVAAIGSLLGYRVGLDSVEAFAVACDTVASKRGNVGATFNLGWSFAEGNGVPRNLPKALALLRRAERLGSLDAANYLGFCLRNGLGLTKDPRRGFKKSLKAAEDGLPAAQRAVAYCYLDGDGVPRNPQEALRWMRMAAAGRDRHAMDYIARRRRRAMLRKRPPRGRVRRVEGL